MPLVVQNNIGSKAIQVTALILFVVLALVVQHYTKLKVKTPFIDEIFHLRQCQTYCAGRFSEWDSKITTPPGLYLLGYAYARALNLVGIDGCSDTSLRSLNLVGGLLVLPWALGAFKRQGRLLFWRVNIVSQPLLFTYYSLYYTDVWSAILIIIALGYSIKKPFSTTNCWISGVWGLISLWFRQPNIVWVGFILSVAIDERVGPESNLFARIQKYISKALTEWSSVVPFVVNFVAFLVFVKINGGVAMGDKDNHLFNLHFVQVFYCFTFINFFTWPVWLSRKTLVDYANFTILNNYGLNSALNAGIALLIKYIIENFTVVHPFLLADNRHYSFYIFKRLIEHKCGTYLAIPVYHFATWNVINRLKQAKKLSPITILAFLGTVFCIIVPSPLFEPRYYILPLLVFRIFIQPENDNRNVLEFFWLNTINVGTALVFFNYEFRWASEPLNIQRIIW